MDWLTNKIKGWRTIIVNGLMAILPVLELTELVNVLPPETQAWYLLALALVNIGMRSITNTPVGQKY